MKKIYGLIKNSSERNYRVHEDFDELDCRIYFDLEECKNAFKSDIDDFLGWTFCDHTKEEIIADYNGEGNYNTGVEEYRESEDSFYISFDCCNFDGYYNLDIVTLEVDDNITKENISYYFVELMEKDKYISSNIKAFDNKKDKDISLNNEINNFVSKLNITLEELEQKVDDCFDITEIELDGNKHLSNFIRTENSGFIEYYENDGKRDVSSSINYYTYS